MRCRVSEHVYYPLAEYRSTTLVVVDHFVACVPVVMLIHLLTHFTLFSRECSLP